MEKVITIRTLISDLNEALKENRPKRDKKDVGEPTGELMKLLNEHVKKPIIDAAKKQKLSVRCEFFMHTPLAHNDRKVLTLYLCYGKGGKDENEYYTAKLTDDTDRFDSLDTPIDEVVKNFVDGQKSKAAFIVKTLDTIGAALDGRTEDEQKLIIDMARKLMDAQDIFEDMTVEELVSMSLLTARVTEMLGGKEQTVAFVEAFAEAKDFTYSTKDDDGEEIEAEDLILNQSWREKVRKFLA